MPLKFGYLCVWAPAFSYFCIHLYPLAVPNFWKYTVMLSFDCYFCDWHTSFFSTRLFIMSKCVSYWNKNLEVKYRVLQKYNSGQCLHEFLTSAGKCFWFICWTNNYTAKVYDNYILKYINILDWHTVFLLLLLIDTVISTYWTSSDINGVKGKKLTEYRSSCHPALVSCYIMFVCVSVGCPRDQSGLR